MVDRPVERVGEQVRTIVARGTLPGRARMVHGCWLECREVVVATITLGAARDMTYRLTQSICPIVAGRTTAGHCRRSRRVIECASSPGCV
jgi:hypothetical protein